mmetsp:Transcript_6049/g.8230  ORF Transcript_6049/g.8230 Transcript_6049/m.8230 type:complete len:152 (-) Transcript_6049:91-546(-)
MRVPMLIATLFLGHLAMSTRDEDQEVLAASPPSELEQMREDLGTLQKKEKYTRAEVATAENKEFQAKRELLEAEEKYFVAEDAANKKNNADPDLNLQKQTAWKARAVKQTQHTGAEKTLQTKTRALGTATRAVTAKDREIQTAEAKKKVRH